MDRREWMKALPGAALAMGMAGGMAGSMTGPARAADTPGTVVPTLTLAMRLRILTGPPQELGMVDGVRKRIIPITGGTVEGPRLTGRIVPGGADWQSIRPDGTADILARHALEASDGTMIALVSPGYRHGPADVLARVAAGETVDPARYYFRTTPRFEVSPASAHGWLGRTVFVGSGARYRDHVALAIFAVG